MLGFNVFDINVANSVISEGQVFGKHSHDLIISIRGEFWTHKISKTPPLFQSQENFELI